MSEEEKERKRVSQNKKQTLKRGCAVERGTDGDWHGIIVDVMLGALIGGCNGVL